MGGANAPRHQAPRRRLDTLQETREMKPLSRQRLTQIKNVKNGMCQIHKDRPLWRSTVYCQECLEKHILRQGVQRQRPLKAEWANVNWKLDNAEIAEQMGVSYAAVCRQRKSAGVKNPRKTRWDSVNWNRPSSEIAEELGVTPPAVHNQRKKLAK